MKKIIQIQFFVLLVGTVFAWTNFLNELFDWLNDQPCETNCVANNALINPFLTPCFYGALFFLAAFLLSLMLLFAAREKKGKKDEIGEGENKGNEGDNI